MVGTSLLKQYLYGAEEFKYFQYFEMENSGKTVVRMQGGACPFSHKQLKGILKHVRIWYNCYV